MNYLDTSALIKRFAREPGSDAVEELLESGEPVVVCRRLSRNKLPSPLPMND